MVLFLNWIFLLFFGSNNRFIVFANSSFNWYLLYFIGYFGRNPHCDQHFFNFTVLECVALMWIVNELSNIVDFIIWHSWDDSVRRTEPNLQWIEREVKMSANWRGKDGSVSRMVSSAHWTAFYRFFLFEFPMEMFRSNAKIQWKHTSWRCRHAQSAEKNPLNLWPLWTTRKDHTSSRAYADLSRIFGGEPKFVSNMEANFVLELHFRRASLGFEQFATGHRFIHADFYYCTISHATLARFGRWVLLMDLISFSWN